MVALLRIFCIGILLDASCLVLLAQTLEISPPLVTSEQARTEFKKLLATHKGATAGASQERATALHEFIKQHASSTTALSAYLIYAADLIAVGLAQAGDQNYDRGRKIFERIATDYSDVWQGDYALVGLLGAMNVSGNENDQIVKVCRRLASGAPFSRLDRKDDPDLDVLRTANSVTGSEARAAVRFILGQVIERTEGDKSELEALKKKLQDPPVATVERKEIPPIDPTPTGPQTPPINRKAPARKAIAETEKPPRVTPGPVWAAAIVIFAAGLCWLMRKKRK